MTLALEVPAQSDALTAGSLNAECGDLTEALSPSEECDIAASRGRNLQMTEVATEVVFSVPDMALLMSVDADCDAYWIVNVCDIRWRSATTRASGWPWQDAHRNDDSDAQVLPDQDLRGAFPPRNQHGGGMHRHDSW